MLFQIILISILVGVVCILLLLLQPINLQSYNLAVIGSVLDEDTNQPIANAEVILEDIHSGERLRTFSRQDGGFWFRLHPQAQYRLLLLDSQQKTIDKKDLSTLSVESKIFDVTLTGTQSTAFSYMIAQ